MYKKFKPYIHKNGDAAGIRVMLSSILTLEDNHADEKTFIRFTITSPDSCDYLILDCEFTPDEANAELESLFKFLDDEGVKFNSLTELVGLTFDTKIKESDDHKHYEMSDMELILEPLGIPTEKYNKSKSDERLGNEIFNIGDARIFVVNVSHGFDEGRFCALKTSICISKTDGQAYINYENFSVKENADEYQELRNFLTSHSLETNDFKGAIGAIYDASVTYLPQHYAQPIRLTNRRMLRKPQQITAKEGC